MKFTIEKEPFLTALGVAARGASTRSAIQTLAGVMLQAEGDHVELQATDMELGVRVGVSAKPEREGNAARAIARRLTRGQHPRPDAPGAESDRLDRGGG